MTDQPRKIENRFPDGSVSLGAATEELAVRRFRRPDGQIEPEVGGDGRVHIFASLSEGQLVEKTVDHNATKRIIAAGDVSIDRPDVASHYLVRGASDIIQISLVPEGVAGLDSDPIGPPRLNESAPELETIAYRVAQAIWLGEAQDALFMSSVLQSARASLGRRVRYPYRGGLSSGNVRLLSEFIEARIRPVQAVSPTLAELASEVGLSVFHFTRAFRQTFGLSPYRYLLRRRLGQARDMLAAGETNLHRISRRCGSSSVPHLTNAFSREMGIAPARFRRILREVERTR